MLPKLHLLYEKGCRLHLSTIAMNAELQVATRQCCCPVVVRGPSLRRMQVPVAKGSNVYLPAVPSLAIDRMIVENRSVGLTKHPCIVDCHLPEPNPSP